MVAPTRRAAPVISTTGCSPTAAVIGVLMDDRYAGSPFHCRECRRSARRTSLEARIARTRRRRTRAFRRTLRVDPQRDQGAWRDAVFALHGVVPVRARPRLL